MRPSIPHKAVSHLAHHVRSWLLARGPDPQAMKKKRDDLVRFAHDMKSPITVLKLVLENMPDDRSAVIAMRMAIERLENMANEILESSMARLRSGDISQVVRQVLIEKQAVLRRRKITVRVTESGKPGVVALGEGEIHRLVANFLDNSMRSIEADGDIKIVIDFGSNEVRLDIEDSGNQGKGPLSAILCEQAFSRGFSQTQSTGLGLYYAKEVVNGAGGKISLRPMGQGALLRIVLPVK